LELRRRLGAVAVLLALAAASAGAIAATGGGASEVAKKKPLKYEAADLFIETNATDRDIGLQLFMDADAWDTFKLFDPEGRKVMQQARTRGRLHGWGLTEYFWETEEPEFSEVPLSEFKKRFPEGKYTFRGKTVDGRKLVGSDRLSHVIPAGPVITSPTKGEVVDPNSFVVSWEPVTKPAGVKIVSYEVIVGQGGRELDMHLPPEVTSVSIPPEFLSPGTKGGGEVLAREKSGNQTISAIPRYMTK
jgi:hypothetical protein